MEFHYAPGATPLDPDEAAGLVPTHITTQGDLNAWEQVNIAQGDRWAARQKKRDLLDEGFIRELHRKMFDKTWQWAGTFRHSKKTLEWTGRRWRLGCATCWTIQNIKSRTMFTMRMRWQCGFTTNWCGFMHSLTAMDAMRV